MRNFFLMLSVVFVLISCKDELKLESKEVIAGKNNAVSAIKTYDCDGDLNEDKVTMKIYLPEIVDNNRYYIEGLYNVSSYTDNKLIILLKDETARSLCSDDLATYGYNFNISRIIGCKGAFNMDLDENINVVLLHENNISESEMIQKGRDIFDDAIHFTCEAGVSDFAESKTKEISFTPKRCGMGIIKP